MRSAKDILKDLGFNPDASSDAQQAFIKHLKRAARESLGAPAPKIQRKDQYRHKSPAKNPDEGRVQLEFDFENDKKVS